MATVPPAEVLESVLPVMFRKWAVRPDSAGPGKHRGGFGAIYEIELLDDRGTGFVFAERGRFPSRGAAGGGDAALNVVSYEQDDGHHIPEMTSKAVDIRLRKGDRIRIESPGGGGYGPATERDADHVAEDVRLGFVSRDNAAAQYGVVLADDGSVDSDATLSARAAMGAAE